MEIYRIRLDSNVFQSFLPEDPEIWKTDRLKLDCTKKSDRWQSPSVYVHNPKLKWGSFTHFCSGGFVVDSLAVEKLQGIFEWAGELLPINHQGKSFRLVNVLECVNCLDDAGTKWVLGKTTGAKIRIKEYAFHKDRLSESTLFKIPETCAGEVLTVSGIKDPEDEFKSIVEREGLTGIIFEKVWSAK